MAKTKHAATKRTGSTTITYRIPDELRAAFKRAATKAGVNETALLCELLRRHTSGKALLRLPGDAK